MIEIPDEPMLDTLFGSGAGNLYAINGTGGRWTRFIADDFPKRTNDADQDWTDIEDAIAALNDTTLSREVWRQRLEAQFEVCAFLRWLALNTLVGNNDAYGGLSAHNAISTAAQRHRDRLFWIPWDHDLAIPSATGAAGGSGGPGFGEGGGTGQAAALDLFHTRIGAEWPLIRRAQRPGAGAASHRISR